MKKLLVILSTALILASCENTISSNFGGVDPTLTVSPTQIMILGTPHLSNYSEDLNLADLEPLLERLEKYAPDIITIESSSGMTCNRVRSYPLEHAGYANYYCFDGEPYRAESGLSVSDGSFHAHHILLDWPSQPTVEQRKTLTAAFLASEEPESALVQWLQLNKKDRQIGEGVGAMSVEFLNEFEKSMNESRSIAARLAARLGLEKVYYTDDHGSYFSSDAESKAYGARLNELWPQHGDPCRTYWDELEVKLKNGDVIEAYEEYNSQLYGQKKLDCDFKRTMNDSEPEGYGRKYTLDWQARNLRMVSMIVSAAADKPGGKVLSIVGAAHKPYYQAYLHQMHDIEVVSTDEVLK